MNMFSNKGVSLYLAVILMTMLLALVLGVSTILFRQLQSIRGMEESVVALYAADSGIEKVLVDIVSLRIDPQRYYSATLGNGASYDVEVLCCGAGYLNCAWDPYNDFACPLATSPTDFDRYCPGYFYCIKSRGYYGSPGDPTKTQRTIEVSL